jgi:hypothetical protein
MARIDDYKQALALAKDSVKESNPDLMASLSGADLNRDEDGALSISLKFLNREVTMDWPEMDIRYSDSEEEINIQEQILIFHYLMGALSSGGAGITGDWIAFQDIPDGKFYMDPFNRRAKIPMVQAFGHDPERLPDLAKMAFAGEPSDQGDVSVVIQAFPLVYLNLIIWKGDDEFPPDGNILFDRNVQQILSAEDVAWLSGMVVYPLMGMAKS